MLSRFTIHIFVESTLSALPLRILRFFSFIVLSIHFSLLQKVLGAWIRWQETSHSQPIVWVKTLQYWNVKAYLGQHNWDTLTTQEYWHVKKRLTFFRLLSRLNKLDLGGLLCHCPANCPLYYTKPFIRTIPDQQLLAVFIKVSSSVYGIGMLFLGSKVFRCPKD